MYDKAIDIGLTTSQFEELTLAEFYERVEIENRREISKWRHTRLIIAALTGKDARDIIALPGDYSLTDDLIPSSPQRGKEIEQRLLKLGIGKLNPDGSVEMDVKAKGSC